MGLNKEISVKWEAVIWIPAYAFAYMVIEAVCTESLRLPANIANPILAISSVLLTVAFIVHAIRMPKAPPLLSAQEPEPPRSRTCIPRFEDQADTTGHVMFDRNRTS